MDLRETGEYYEGIMRRAAIEWSKDQAAGQGAAAAWWDVVPETVRSWIIEGYYASMISTLQSRAEIWRNKHQRLLEQGKSDQKYRRLLTQAETADMYRGRITEWRNEFRRSPANFRGFFLTGLE